MKYINTQKQYIRMWFEFYRMALIDDDLKENIKRSKLFYKPWGDVSSIKFDHWWKEHKSLFGISMTREINRVSNHANSLNVSIPLNQPVSKTIRELKNIIEKKQDERLKELGLNAKSLKTKSVTYGNFEVTHGVEIRGKTLYEIQLMYKIWLDMGKPAINTEYCMEVVNKLRSRPRARWIPYLLQEKPVKDRKGNLRYSDDQIRQVRRYINKGKKVCESVSKGEFPGRNSL